MWVGRQRPQLILSFISPSLSSLPTVSCRPSTTTFTPTTVENPNKSRISHIDRNNNKVFCRLQASKTTTNCYSSKPSNKQHDNINTKRKKQRKVNKVCKHDLRTTKATRIATNNNNRILMHQIQKCRNGFELGHVIRNDKGNLLFASSSLNRKRVDYINRTVANSASVAALNKIQELQPKLKCRDLSGLLNALCKHQQLQYHHKQQLLHGYKANYYRNYMLSILIKESISKIDKFNPRDISMVVNALSKIQDTNPERSNLLFQRAGEKVIDIIDRFNAQALANTINAYGKMDFYHLLLFNTIAKKAIQLMDTFTPQESTMTIHAYAKMMNNNSKDSYANPTSTATKLFNLVAIHSISKIEQFNAQELSNLTNSYSKANIFHLELFDSIVKASIDNIDTFTAQGLSNLVNGFAKMSTSLSLQRNTDVYQNQIHLLHDKQQNIHFQSHQQVLLFDCVAIRAIKIIQSFTGQGLSILINAYTKMNYYDEHYIELFDAVASATIKNIHNFNSQELSITAHAYAKWDTHKELKYTEELFYTIAKATMKKIDEYNAQELATTVNAYAKVVMDREFLQSTGSISRTISTSMNANVFFTPLSHQVERANKNKDTHNHTNNYYPELLDTVANASIQIIHTFNAQGLAILANAYSRLNYDHTELFDCIAKATDSIIDTFNTQELANILTAFTKMGYPLYQHNTVQYKNSDTSEILM